MHGSDKLVTVDDLQNLRNRVINDNPLARSDSVFAMKLFRAALRENGAIWENAAFDRCFSSLVARERRDEQPVPTPTPRPMPTRVYVAPVVLRPTVRQREAVREAGRSKYDRARDGIMTMRFPNGRDLLSQTVEDVQKFGTWAGAILRALPKSAKPSDKIGKHLTWDQLTRIRTFEVAEPKPEAA